MEEPKGFLARSVWRLQCWDQRLKEAPLLRTLSMCMNYGQTLYAFSMLQRPAVAWPDASWELLSWTKLLTVDVEFMKPDCVVPLPYFTKWIGKFCFPFGLVLVLICVTLHLARAINKESHDIALSARPNIFSSFVFSLAMVIYVCLIWHLKVVLSPVDCNWCREGVTCLDENALVECWSDDPTWRAMMIISVIDFVFISGAFLSFLTLAIWHQWLMEGSKGKGFRKNGGITGFGEVSWLKSFTTFFVAGYRGSADGGNLVTFGWELVVLWRKLLLLLAAKFTTVHPVRGANLQLLVLFAALLGQLTLRPYMHQLLNNVDGILNTFAFITLLSACQLTMGVGESLGIVYEVLNVSSLFTGALLAVGLCLRKLHFAWQNEVKEGGP